MVIIHWMGRVDTHRQVEETSRLETKVVELVEEVETRGREVERLMHTQAATHTSLQQATTLSDALKTDNFILSRHLRNVRVRCYVYTASKQTNDCLITNSYLDLLLLHILLTLRILLHYLRSHKYGIFQPIIDDFSSSV